MPSNNSIFPITLSRKVSKWGPNTGWITIPIKLRPNVPIGQSLEITISYANQTFTYITKYQQNKNTFGFSVPKKVIAQHPIIGKTVSIRIEEKEGFFAKVSAYKQIIIPQDQLQRFGISEFDLIEIRVLTGKHEFTEVVKLARTVRANKAGEVMGVIRLHNVDPGRVQIEILRKVELAHDHHTDQEISISALFDDGTCALINDHLLIIFHGRHVPIITPRYVKISDIAHYMGAYFADGTKKGHAWRIVASTPEQAVYYTEMCELLTPLEEFKYSLVYTKQKNDRRDDNHMKQDLIVYWKNKTYGLISLRPDKIYILETESEEGGSNWNKYGALVIDKGKGLVMMLQRRVLEFLKGIITHQKDKNLTWQFLMGVLEGDGHVSGGKSSIGLGITAEMKHKIFFETLMKVQSIQFNLRAGPKGVNVFRLRISLYSILSNLAFIHEKLFSYYPKRRMRFVNRMKKMKYILYIIDKNSIPTRGFYRYVKNYNLNIEEVEMYLRNLLK